MTRPEFGADLYGMCAELSNSPKEAKCKVHILATMARADPEGFDQQIRAMGAAIAQRHQLDGVVMYA